MNTTSKINRNTAIKLAMDAIIVLGIVLSICIYKFATGTEYHMVMNGDNPFEIALNEQYVDPGVTFTDDNGKPVSAKKQAELEKKMTISGLDELDTSTAGNYHVTYAYNNELLTREVDVLAGEESNLPNNTGGDDKKDNGNGTTEAGEKKDDDQAPSESDALGDADASSSSSSTYVPNTNNVVGANTAPATEDDNGGNKNTTGTNQTTGNTGNPHPSNTGNGNDNNGNNENTNTPIVKRGAYILPQNVTYTNCYVAYDGEEHSLTVNNLPYGIEAIYDNNTATDAGEYGARVTFELSNFMKTIYDSVEPSSMEAVLTIYQATPEYKVPTGLTARVGQTLKDVKLPKGFSFEQPLTTSVGSAGYNTFKVTYTPDDTVNYKTVEHIKVTIHVLTNSVPNNNQGSGGGSHTDRRAVYYLPADVTFENFTTTYDGATHTITVNNAPSGIDITYAHNSGKDAGTYNAIAYFTIGDALKDKYYSVYPASMMATLTINKATPTYVVPTGLTAKVGQTLKDVKLPDGFEFEDSQSTSVGAEGSHVFKVTFTPTDTKNFEIVKGIDVTINVTKESNPGPGPGPGPVTKPLYQLPNSIVFADRTETYTGTEYAIIAENVPEELKVSYKDNTRTDAGSQTAIATFSLSAKGLEKYSGIEGSATMTAELKINPAEPTYTVPSGLTAVEGQTLANVAGQLGKGFEFEKDLSTSVGNPGYNEFTVKYTPNSSNYKVVTGIKVTIHVTAKTPTTTKETYVLPANVSFPDVTGTYGEQSAFTAVVVNLPAEISASYFNETRSNWGEQTARVEFSVKPEFSDLYDSVEPSFMEAKITIGKATPEYTVPTGLTATVGQTLEDIKDQLGEGFYFEDESTPVGNPGDNTFTVKYVPSDENYQTVTGIEVTVTVNSASGTKKDPPVTFNDATFIYRPNEEFYAIYVEDVPVGIEVEKYYVDGEEVEDEDWYCDEVGTYEITAKLKFDEDQFDPDEYNDTVTAYLTIAYGATFELTQVPDEEKVVISLNLTGIHKDFDIGIGSITVTELLYEHDVFEFEGYETFGNWCKSNAQCEGLPHWQGEDSLYTHSTGWFSEEWILETEPQEVLRLIFSVKEIPDEDVTIGIETFTAEGEYLADGEDAYWNSFSVSVTEDDTLTSGPIVFPEKAKQ